MPKPILMEFQCEGIRHVGDVYYSGSDCAIVLSTINRTASKCLSDLTRADAAISVGGQRYNWSSFEEEILNKCKFIFSNSKDIGPEYR